MLGRTSYKYQMLNIIRCWYKTQFMHDITIITKSMLWYFSLGMKCKKLDSAKLNPMKLPITLQSSENVYKHTSIPPH